VELAQQDIANSAAAAIKYLDHSEIFFRRNTQIDLEMN